MDDKKYVREYFDDYIKYYPERWNWQLKGDGEQSELYLKTRARRCLYPYHDSDLLPDFYSIERDAGQFELTHVEWTDFLGLVWEGDKGVYARAGALNYQGSLYYKSDDGEYEISDDYDACNNQPPEEIYTKVEEREATRWIDTANVCDVDYKYIVHHHLFIVTHIELTYGDGEIIRVYDGFLDLIAGLLRHGKRILLEKTFKSMNEHFIRLINSDKEDVRKFYPGETAEEMFLKEK